MSADVLLRALEDGVLTITLNRPEKRNAMSDAVVEGLGTMLADADVNADVNVVALRGAGTDFCSGADLEELLASVDAPLAEHEANAQRLGDVFLAIRSLTKPVVAAVHGRALAGGCGLATACDIVLAHEDARFGYPEIQRGFVPAMVMAMLRRCVGERIAFELMATGRTLSASEARDIGMVSRVFPAAAFDTEVAKVLAELARASTSALALLKQQLYASDGAGFEDAIRMGARVNAVARSTPDFRKAVSAFLKK